MLKPCVIDLPSGRAARVVFTRLSCVSYESMLARSPIQIGPPQLFIVCTILVLCACVMMQMLGVPATLWHSSALPDTFGASVFEGLSLPASTPLVYDELIALLPESIRQNPHIPLLAHSLFHPPVLEL